jgi:hypothetical protein
VYQSLERPHNCVFLQKGCWTYLEEVSINFLWRLSINILGVPYQYLIKGKYLAYFPGQGVFPALWTDISILFVIVQAML